MDFLKSNILKIKQKKSGFDIVIVVSSNNNSKYWEWRLSKTKKFILPSKTKIICVEENWKNKEGAGQLLGTLNAILEANKKINIKKALFANKKIAIYHTAGKGKRMAPLTGKEKNNKPAIKLPMPIKIESKNNLISLLEAVIFSTQIFSKSRKGRICVFWGDQIIIPSRKPQIETNFPVEIFATKKEFFLTKEEWEKNWKMYGILIPQKEGVLQREKLSFEKIKELKKKKILPLRKNKVILFKSFGCFSISAPLLFALIEEFSKELKERKEKLDIDPDLWTPLTSPKKDFENKSYWERINKFKKAFEEKEKTPLIIEGKDLGEKTIFFDFGNLQSYYENLIKITEKSSQAKLVRNLFGIEKYFKNGSLIINSKINGKIKNSVVLNSKIKKADIKKAVIINSEIKEIIGKNILLYYIKEKNTLKPLPNEVITDIKIKEGEIIRMKTNISRDGKEDWKIKLPQNPFSYEELEKLISRIEIK